MSKFCWFVLKGRLPNMSMLMNFLKCKLAFFFHFFFSLFFYIGIYLIYDVLVSGILQSDSVVHYSFSDSFPI